MGLTAVKTRARWITFCPAEGIELMTGLLTTAGESVFLGGRMEAE